MAMKYDNELNNPNYIDTHECDECSIQCERCGRNCCIDENDLFIKDGFYYCYSCKDFVDL